MKNKGIMDKVITIVKWVAIIIIALVAVQITANLGTKYISSSPKTTKLGFENVGQLVTQTAYLTVVKDNKKNIATALAVAAQNIASAKESYNYANSFANLQETNMAIANQRFSLGMISKLELDTQKVTTENAKRALEQSRYAINQAIANYDWALKGLASTS